RSGPAPPSAGRERRRRCDLAPVATADVSRAERGSERGPVPCLRRRRHLGEPRPVLSAAQPYIRHYGSNGPDRVAALVNTDLRLRLLPTVYTSPRHTREEDALVVSCRASPASTAVGAEEPLPARLRRFQSGTKKANRR